MLEHSVFNVIIFLQHGSTEAARVEQRKGALYFCGRTTGGITATDSEVSRLQSSAKLLQFEIKIIGGRRRRLISTLCTINVVESARRITFDPSNDCKLIVGCTRGWINRICQIIVTNCRPPVPLCVPSN